MIKQIFVKWLFKEVRLSNGILENSIEQQLKLEKKFFKEVSGDFITSTKEVQHLKYELDNLRLQNQKLRLELNKFMSSGYLFRRTIKTSLITVIHKLQRIEKRLLKSHQRKNLDNKNSNFKPYKIKILHPLQTNRPVILHVIGNFYTGGSARLVVDLIEHLGHKFEQKVITQKMPVTPAYTGLEIIHYERLQSSKKIKSILKQIKPDLIHIHYLGWYEELDWKWYSEFFQAAEDYGCKVIENINVPTEPFISRSVNYYVYVSNSVKNKFGRLDGQNITIYPGSDLSLFSRKNGTDIPDDCIGMVYRLEGDKLDEKSIEVFIKVVKRKKNTKVLIIGGGYFFEKYRAAVNKAGVEDAFVFTGYVSYDDLPALLHKLSIFVAPVHSESFGQVSSFAMGLKLPVVGYKVGGLQEIVSDRALLAPPGDSDALADIIVTLLNDRERRLKIGASNQQRVRELFSVEAMIKSYNFLYAELLNAK